MGARAQWTTSCCSAFRLLHRSQTATVAAAESCSGNGRNIHQRLISMLITGTAVANPPLKRIRHTHSTTMSEAAAASLKAWKNFVITHHRETRGFLPHTLFHSSSYNSTIAAHKITLADCGAGAGARNEVWVGNGIIYYSPLYVPPRRRAIMKYSLGTRPRTFHVALIVLASCVYLCVSL